MGSGVQKENGNEKTKTAAGGYGSCVKRRLTMCLACYHACPQHAIQYGNRTKNKGQYKVSPD